MNQCHLMGNLTRDVEVKDVNGSKLVKFGIAVNERKDVLFVDCEAWDKTAELIETYLKKGDRVIVHGSLRQSNWTTPDGSKRSKMYLRVSGINFVGGGRERGPDGQDEASATRTAKPAPDAGDDGTDEDGIPF